MIDLSKAAEATLEPLTVQGIKATWDPAKAEIPGIVITPNLVRPIDLAHERLEITWDIFLIGRPNGQELSQLSPLVSAALDLLGVTELRGDVITLPSQSPTALPCFTGTFKNIVQREED